MLTENWIKMPGAERERVWFEIWETGLNLRHVRGTDSSWEGLTYLRDLWYKCNSVVEISRSPRYPWIYLSPNLPIQIPSHHTVKSVQNPDLHVFFNCFFFRLHQWPIICKVWRIEKHEPWHLHCMHLPRGRESWDPMIRQFRLPIDWPHWKPKGIGRPRR